MTRAIRAALGLLLLPMPVLAQEACPTAADLRAGIEATFADGTRMVFRAEGEPGWVLGDVTAPGGERSVADVAPGGFSTRAEGTGPGGRGYAIRYDYGRPDGAPPRIEPGMDERIAYEAVSAEESFRVVERWTAGPAKPVTLGGCSYGGVRVVVVDEARPESRRQMLYVPELGLRWLDWLEAGDERRDWVLTGFKALP